MIRDKSNLRNNYCQTFKYCYDYEKYLFHGRKINSEYSHHKINLLKNKT
jgi:hypothetical protein